MYNVGHCKGDGVTVDGKDCTVAAAVEEIEVKGGRL
jgi:hypothetical protein